MRPFLIAVPLLLILQAQAPAEAQSLPRNCGTLRSQGQYGPYDYRKDKDRIDIVLRAHFNSDVESLVSGMSSTIAGDIDYTLRALPNYVRALDAMRRLGERDKTSIPHGAHFTVECYFQRAVVFAPDDHVARMLYASFLLNNKRKDEAIEQLNYVREAMDPQAVFTRGNLGLLYVEAGRYDDALAQAHAMMALGATTMPLRDRLIAEGKWVEPAAAAASAPASAASN